MPQTTEQTKQATQPQLESDLKKLELEQLEASIPVLEKAVVETTAAVDAYLLQLAQDPDYLRQSLLTVAGRQSEPWKMPEDKRKKLDELEAASRSAKYQLETLVNETIPKMRKRIELLIGHEKAYSELSGELARYNELVAQLQEQAAIVRRLSNENDVSCHFKLECSQIEYKAEFGDVIVTEPYTNRHSMVWGLKKQVSMVQG